MRRQYGALPWLRDAAGEVRIVLITTRETGRWSIPRGNPMRGRAPRKAAAIEAYEEAGVLGRVGRKSLGTYDYDKRVDDALLPTRVKVFPFRVSGRAKSWPERDQRLVQDFPAEVAATLLGDERALAEIVADFSPKKASKAKPTSKAKRNAKDTKAYKPKLGVSLAKGKARRPDPGPAVPMATA